MREQVHSLPPDETLFRGPRAPARFAEDDPYEQDRRLPVDVELPDSDLLKAIHAYAADFYDRQFAGDSAVDHQSMDETALLAMGYLINEASTQILGKTGDMALVEGQLPDGEPGVEGSINGYTYEDLPSVNSQKSGQAFSQGVWKKLGFMRFTHPPPTSNEK
jgi:hypothetical protein